MNSLTYWKAGSGLAASAIALGAFGAHGLPKLVGDDRSKIRNWVRASQYQLIQGITILLLSSIPTSVRKHHELALPLMLGGTVVFSGSIYLVSFRRKAGLIGRIPPLGGFTMIAGYIALLF